jgi:hypothetical protein
VLIFIQDFQVKLIAIFARDVHYLQKFFRKEREKKIITSSEKYVKKTSTQPGAKLF